MDRRLVFGVMIVVGIVLMAVGVFALDSDAPAEDATAGVTPTSEPSSTTTFAPPTTTTTTPSTTTTTAPTTTIPDETVEEFIAALAEAFRETDGAFLFERLHSAIIDTYGRDQCEGHTAALESPTLELAVDGVAAPEPWLLSMDGLELEIPNAIDVQVTRAENDTVAETSIHVALEDGRYRWFTDCGDPAS